MEKTLSADERIKRAEEIYYRKKMQNSNRKSARVNVSSKKDFRMLRRMTVQIAVCILIYIIFYVIQNTNHIFSEDVLRKTRYILSYDINIKNLYEKGINYINSFGDNEQNDENVIQNQSGIESNIVNETELNDTSNNNSISLQEQNIGGENIEVDTEETVELTQMEQDAKYILENKSLIIPLKGTITSRFGLRDPETPTVPKNHTGIDIAVNEGTVFIASMSGIVHEVSNKRRFR